MASNDWQVILANSDDLTKIADISNFCRGKQLELAMNRAGSFAFNVPMGIDEGAYMNPVEHCIILLKDKQIVWSGPIWTKEENFDEGKVNVSASGWFQLLHKRYVVSEEQVFTNTTDGAIAATLLLIANTQYNIWITLGTNNSTAPRTMTIARWSNIGQEIENLTEIEAGLDFTINPETRVLDIHAWNDYSDNGVGFGYGTFLENTTGVVRTTSADEMGNEWYIVGQTQTALANDQTSINQHNLHQQVVNINEANDLQLLGAIANAELAVNKNPRVIVTFVPRPATEDHKIPEAFVDFNLRDKVYLTAEKNGVRIENLAVRVFGFSLEIDDNNNEKITQLQTTYQQG